MLLSYLEIFKQYNTNTLNKLNDLLGKEFVRFWLKNREKVKSNFSQKLKQQKGLLFNLRIYAEHLKDLSKQNVLNLIAKDFLFEYQEVDVIDIWLCCSSELCDPWPSWVNKLYPYLTWIYFLICSYNNERDLLASGILQMILGTGISMKYGSGGGSHKLSSAVCQATDRKCSVSRATLNSLSGKQWRNNKMCHRLFIALLNFGTDFIAINFQTKSCYKNILILYSSLLTLFDFFV